MYGRFSLRTPAWMLAERFQLPEIPPVEPHYNIAPTQPVPTVVMAAGHQR